VGGCWQIWTGLHYEASKEEPPTVWSAPVSRGRIHATAAAVTFALAAGAGVAGAQLTGKLTPALVAFAVLLVVGMALTYWLDRKASSSDPLGGHGQATRDSGATSFDLGGARGVQMRNENRQENYFGIDQEH
jgi:hypothetical protein